MVAEIPISPVEKLRRARGLTQRQLADILLCSDTVIVNAEKGSSIMQKYIERFIAWGEGALQASHFVRARPPKGKTENGKTKIQKNRKHPQRSAHKINKARSGRS